MRLALSDLLVFALGDFMKRRSWVRRLAWAITFVVLTVALGAALFWQETRVFVRQYEEFFKLAGYVLGPLLAVAGFLWGLSEKAELRDQSEELGDGPLATQFYDAVFDELWARIHGQHPNATESP